MAKTEKERSKDYRDRKSKDHSRLSLWFHKDELSEIDKDRGEETRTQWLHSLAKRRLQRARRKAPSK